VAVPVVILYFLRVRLDHHTVATGMFWEQALAPERGRARWQRWRNKVSLAAQLVLVAAATLAAAGLQIPPPQLIVLILDNSATMNAADVPPTRLAAAKEFAGRLVEGLHSEDRMAVLTTGGIPAVVSSASDDAAGLQAAIESIPATHEPSQMAGALLAAQAIPVPPGLIGRIVVLSDACFADAAALSGEHGFEMVRFGTPAPNTAITRLAARRTLPDPRVCEVLVETRNYSPRSAESRLVVALDGRPIDTVNVSMPAEGRWQQVFRMTTAAGGLLAARLDPPDAYPADNEATVAVPPAPTLRIQHVEGVAGDSQASPLFRALAANPLVEILDPQAAEKPPDAGPSVSIRVFEGHVPETLPPGPVLVVDPTACDLWRVGEPVEDPTVARLAEDSPILAGVRMLDVYLDGARRLELASSPLPPGETPKGYPGVRALPFLWTADGTPLGYTIDRPQGRVVVLSGNLEQSNLAMQAALPILVANALDWLSGQPVRGTEKPADCVGGIADARGLDLRGPAELGVEPDAVIIPRPWPPAWLWPAGLALAILVAEWCLYQRRWMT
jgi:hypothetical protein